MTRFFVKQFENDEVGVFYALVAKLSDGQEVILDDDYGELYPTHSELMESIRQAQEKFHYV